jgi:hypothetical protein
MTVTMRVHDVAANLISIICIIKVLSSLLSAFMKKIAELYWHHECRMC